MAKSGKPRVSVLLLAVLAVAVFLHATHRVTAGSSTVVTDEVIEGVTEVLKQATPVIKAITKVGKAFDKEDDDDDDERSAVRPHGSGSTPLISNDRFPSLHYIGVTDIKVGDSPMLQGSSMLDINPKDGSGGVVVSKSFPLTFLNSDAYMQLKTKISNGRAVATSELGADVDQPCYKSGTQQPITLVFDGGEEMNVAADACWYTQSDGSMCLSILPSPWATGETIIGTMLQTGMNVDTDAGKWTFTSTKDGTGSGMSSRSKSNTAAAMKPFLGPRVLLFLTMLAYMA